jgi:hypothetical protein
VIDVAFVSDLRGPLLCVVRAPCQRCERYEVERLIQQYGADAKLPDLLPLVRKLTALLADCPKWRAVSIYDRCKAVRGSRDLE